MASATLLMSAPLASAISHSASALCSIAST
jgi:hypothetical protein